MSSPDAPSPSSLRTLVLNPFTSPLKKVAGRMADAIAWRVAVELGRQASNRPAARKPATKALGYINAKENIRGAEEAGKPVNHYIAEAYGWKDFIPSVERFIAFLKTAEVLESQEGPFDVCEIGPGSGRHLEALQATGRCGRYEVYEGDPDWAEWLGETFGATVCPLQGERLDSTASQSMDLVHAHMTMVYLPFLSVMAYLRDAARVLRPGGWLIFDVFTEDCMPHEILENWLKEEWRYPQIMPHAYLVDQLKNWGLDLVTTSMTVAPKTEYFVFRKNADPA